MVRKNEMNKSRVLYTAGTSTRNCQIDLLNKNKSLITQQVVSLNSAVVHKAQNYLSGKCYVEMTIIVTSSGPMIGHDSYFGRS